MIEIKKIIFTRQNLSRLIERLNMDRMGLRKDTGAQEKCRKPQLNITQVGTVQRRTTQNNVNQEQERIKDQPTGRLL